jgi:protein required for attachment to host cells
MRVEMPLTWIVVADAARARILHLKGHKSGLEEVHDLVNPEARLKGRDLVTDRHGSTHKRMADGRPGMGDNGEVNHQVEKAFAREVAARLRELCRENGVESLVIAAAPRFLGELRRNLDRNTAGLIRQTVNKDLSRLSPEDIKAHLDRAA